MTIHDFDMARSVTGSEVVEVFAVGSVSVDDSIGDAGDRRISWNTRQFRRPPREALALRSRTSFLTGTHPHIGPNGWISFNV